MNKKNKKKIMHLNESFRSIEVSDVLLLDDEMMSVHVSQAVIMPKARHTTSRLNLK